MRAPTSTEGDEHEIGVIGWATCFKHVRTEAADYLLARGAKPTIFSAVSLNRADLVRKLVSDDPALLRMRKMSRFEHHRTPLHLAVLKNRPQMVNLLTEPCAPVLSTRQKLRSCSDFRPDVRQCNVMNISRKCTG